jgi:23S rRNA (adenine-N6)-dimethyltransferase
VAASPVASGDLVVDLGAGTGALTGPLVAAGVRVVAVELDAGRAARLRRRFATDDGVRVVEVDLRGFRLPRRPFRVVASPPYALTTAALHLVLSTDRLLSADLVLQHAAADRLLRGGVGGRHAGRYRLSLGLAVPRRAFRPAPRVDSVVLQVRRR